MMKRFIVLCVSISVLVVLCIAGCTSPASSSSSTPPSASAQGVSSQSLSNNSFSATTSISSDISGGLSVDNSISNGSSLLQSTTDAMQSAVESLYLQYGGSIPTESTQSAFEAAESDYLANGGPALPILQILAANQTMNLNAAYTSMGLNYSISAQGNTLIYTYKYLKDATVDDAKQQEATMQSTNEAQVQEFKAEGVQTAEIKSLYYDKNGNLLYEQDYN